MAKVYSWEVSINPYAYAYIVHPNDTERAYVGTELKGNNLQKVIDWVAECSDEDYIEHFNMVKELCEEKNYSVKFENVNAYMDVNTSCDNLRGPAGKGIINITLTNSTELADTYTINYTDGTNTSFVVRHGKQGEQGEQGKPGDEGVRTYFAMIYTSGRDELDQILETVDTPTGGTYDWTSDELTPPGGWQESDSDNEGNTLKPPVWMSSRTFIKGREEEGGWSKPTMISGENGKPGVDGASLEFIYKQATKISDQEYENLKNENIPGFVPTGWENHPLGVDENNRTEWFTTRLYNKTEEKWGGWNKPAIWSQYGVNGQDGDGVEYIYYLANNATPPDNPTPKEYAEDGDSNGFYSQDEWTPSVLIDYIKSMGVVYPQYDTIISGITIDEATAQKWTDNPTGVDGTNQWEWVAVRKYSGKDKKWGPFSNPSLWSKYGEDGQPGANATTIRKVYNMTDSTNKVPDPPTDNLYTDWNNAFPVDYTIDQCVWCCEAEIWANNNEFVQKYRKLSKSEITTEIEYNAIGVGGASVPTQKIEPEGDYIKMMYSGEYYVWDEGGWSKPYLVTGTKGVDATPMDYVTYVFYYGDRNIQPEEGETGKELSDIVTNEIGGWFDFPKDYTDSPTECWYQCCLSMNSDNTIKLWGGIHPCNGKNGEALPGKYTEFRFAVTNNDSNVPVKPTIITTPGETGSGEIINNRYPGYNISNDSIKRWVATNEQNFPTLGKDQTMWQIFAVINPNGDDGNGGVTDVVEKGWEGPIQVSAENGKDSTVAGPAGKQGVSGIPGANFKVKYCLGTFSENTGEGYWKNNEGKMYPWQIEGDEPYGNGYFGANVNNGIPKHDSDDWYDFIPNTEIVVCDGTKGDSILNYRNGTYLGRVIKRINNYGNICYLQIVLRIVYNPNVASGETYTKRTTWTQAEYDAYNGAEKPYSYYENGKVWYYNHRQVSIDALENEGEDVVENFHVYIWCVQGTETWKKGEVIHNPNGDLETDDNISNGIKWGVPFKLQGTNGLNGLKGADGRSQTVYPMGVYDSNEVYLTTESKAPYVYDPNDSNFYVLNIVNQPWVGVLPDDYESAIIHPSTANSGNTSSVDSIPNVKTTEFIIFKGHVETISGKSYSGNTFYYQWIDGKGYLPASYYKYVDYVDNDGYWIVDQDGTTPCQNYQNNTTNKHEPAWVKFESFEALYTSIGIIENGMIGSAVYNNEFMFSQQGIDESGNITNYASESAENDGGFLSGYEYDREGVVDESGVTKHWKYKGTETYISDNDVNPYEMKVAPTGTTPVHTFRPNITLNFKTGQAYLSTGEITFGKGVMTAHTGIFNNVVVNGTVNKQIIEINEKNCNDYIKDGYLLLSNIPDIIILKNIGEDNNEIKLPYFYPIYYYNDLFDGDEYKFDDGTSVEKNKLMDWDKISINNLCYYTDYGYKKDGNKIVIGDINYVKSLIGRDFYIFNETGGDVYISCGEVFTSTKPYNEQGGICSIKYQDEWTLNPINFADNGKILYNKFTSNKYENYLMHVKHSYLEGNNPMFRQYKQLIPISYSCICRCELGYYSYKSNDTTRNAQAIAWRFIDIDDYMGDINYNDSYLKTVYISDGKGNDDIHEFNIVLDWTWNIYLSSSFEGKGNFTFDDYGYIQYKHTDGQNYYLVNKNTPPDTANLNQSIIINNCNTYYFSAKILN